MDQGRYQEGQELYEAGDYRQAAKTFLAAAGRGTEGNGSAYHMAGNALMRLRRYNDAVSVYRHAVRDETYARRGSVQANLAQALCKLGEYPDALEAFESALEEDDYTTPYKALQGMAGALLEMGRVQDAAVAYRQAALDPVNPDPGKALNNLGLCFMALGRPADAAEAYKAALGFDSYEGRGKALGNLGQAFVALELWNEAVRAFERATELHGYDLSAAAQADYERALSHGGSGATGALTTVAAAAAVETAAHDESAVGSADDISGAEKVEGWETGEIAPPPLTQPTEEFEAAQVGQGWSADQLSELEGVPDARYEAQIDADGHLLKADKAAQELGIGDDEAVDAFFSMTDEEMRERDRDERRAARVARKQSRNPVLIALVAGAVIVAIAAVVGGSWFFGLGWPTQSQTVNGLLSAHQEGAAVESYWVAVPDTDVAKDMAKVPPVDQFTIDSVERGSSTAVARVTVTPSEGAPLRYSVTLAREGVGWKVTGVENEWSSVGGQ